MSCLSPSHTDAVNSQSEDEANIANTLTTATTSVQDASNQTESPPVSDDENSLQNNDEQFSTSALAVAAATPPQPILPLHQQQQTQQVIEKEESVDISGLQLLSNSIEQFESVRIQQSETQHQAHIQVETKIKMEVDDNKLQSFNDDESIANVASSVVVNIDLTNVIVKQEKECADDEIPVDEAREEIEQDENKTEMKMETNNVSSDNSSSNMLGGLGLLCELAHQRFIEEEEAAAENLVRQRSLSPYDRTSCKCLLCVIFAYFVLFLIDCYNTEFGQNVEAVLLR